MKWVTIYLPHMLFLCAIFAIFLLSATRAYAKSEVGPRSVVRPFAALTKIYLTRGEHGCSQFYQPRTERSVPADTPLERLSAIHCGSFGRIGESENSQPEISHGTE